MQLASGPDLISAFEDLYDTNSGGWFMPGWIHPSEPFVPTKASDWQALYSRDYPRYVHFSPIEKEVGDFFSAFCRMTRPVTILETGTNMGYSTSKLAIALQTYAKQSGRIITIDVGRSGHLFAGTDLAPNITFIEGSSLEVTIPDLTFDLLVLDSEHTYGTIIQEVIRFEPMLRLGGQILFHDSFYYDGVGLAVLDLLRNPRFEVTSIPTPRSHLRNTRSPGVTIARKVGSGPAYPVIADPGRFKTEANLPGRSERDPPLIDVEHARKMGL